MITRDFTGFSAETERLHLRPYDLADLAAHHDLHRREDVVRYLPWRSRDAAECAAAINRSQQLRWAQDGDAVNLAAFEKGTGRLAGEFIIILRSVEHGNGELGYVLHPDLQRQGFGIEGAGALLQVAFDLLGMRRMVARLDTRNLASAALAERLGMRREAHLVHNEFFKGELSDEYDYAMLVSEWEAQPHRSLTGWR